MVGSIPIGRRPRATAQLSSISQFSPLDPVIGELANADEFGAFAMMDPLAGFAIRARGHRKRRGRIPPFDGRSLSGPRDSGKTRFTKISRGEAACYRRRPAFPLKAALRSP